VNCAIYRIVCMSQLLVRDMSRTISGRIVSRVKVVDDDENARRVMALNVSDAELEPLQDPGPLPDLQKFVETSKATVDAVVCDHSIHGQYAQFDGAQATAELFKEKCPAVLCTRWTSAAIDAIRQYIPFIPSLLSIDDANPDTIVEGIDRCIREFNGNPVPSRRTWRTLIRVEEVQRDSRPELFFVVVSGWDSKEVIRLPLDLIPENRRKLIEPGARFFAQVNKGADRPETLFFRDFEF
jgi:hypothetical protein